MTAFILNKKWFAFADTNINGGTQTSGLTLYQLGSEGNGRAGSYMDRLTHHSPLNKF